MPSLNDEMFMKHFEQIKRELLNSTNIFNTHSIRDNSIWDKVRRPSTTFWRNTPTIDMIEVNGIWIMKS